MDLAEQKWKYKFFLHTLAGYHPLNPTISHQKPILMNEEFALHSANIMLNEEPEKFST